MNMFLPDFFIFSCIFTDCLFFFYVMLIIGLNICQRLWLKCDSELLAWGLLNFSIWLLSFALLFYIVPAFFVEPSYYYYYLNDLLITNATRIYIKPFIIFVSLVLLVLTRELQLLGSKIAMVAEFPVLVLIITLCSFGIVHSNDFIVLILFLELFSYSLYIFPIMFGFANLALEATVKYFILGSLSAAFIAMGISLAYSCFGTTNMYFLYSLVQKNYSYEYFYAFQGIFCETRWSFYLAFYSYYLPFILSFVFIFCGLFFKLGVVPFHFWVRDVYEGSPLPVIALFSTLAKIPIAVCVSFLFVLVSHCDVGLVFFSGLLEYVGFFSIVYGTYFGFYQTRINSFIAASSIVNMGYLCMAIPLFFLGATYIFLLYLVIYCTATFFIFFVLGFLACSYGIVINRLTDFAIIRRINTPIAFFLCLLLLSAAGLPPFPGFFPKIFIITSIYLFGDVFFSFFLILLNVINFVLYLRLIRFIYFWASERLDNRVFSSTAGMNFVFLFLIIVFLFFNVFFILLLGQFCWYSFALSF